MESLRERAIQAAKERQERRKRNKREAAEKFAEMAKKEFQERFGEVEINVKPVSGNIAEITAEGLKFTAKKTQVEYAEYVDFYVWIQCANCGKFIHAYCENIADVGDLLMKGEICNDCKYGNVDIPTVESDAERVLNLLREIIEIVKN
ncbi:MAG: hypothetical protein J7J01_10520 [Methanophagales archaeon]|nr:hypothetical protein [Methanophagales archaeon]